MSKIYLLNRQKFENIENLEVFQIEYLYFDINIKKYDALIFTSKNAIFAIDKNNRYWRDIPSYIIAQKTANIAKKFNSNIAFIGNSGHGNEFAYELLPYLKDKKALYIKALKTVSNLCDILIKNGINLDVIVAYKTTCNKRNSIVLEKNSIIIFTSPSSVECFFKRYSWDSSFKAVVIGKTTASYLPKNISYQISAVTSVEECVKLALKIAKVSN